AAIISLTLSLALQGEAFNYGIIFDPLLKIVNAIDGYIYYEESSVKCTMSDFKFQLIGASSLCQQVNNQMANQVCRSFGSSCIDLDGTWGCGGLDVTGERACYFSPTVRAIDGPNIIFDDDPNGYKGEPKDIHQFPFGRKVSQLHNQFTFRKGQPEYRSLSELFSKTFTSTLIRYNETYAAVGKVNARFGVEAFVKVLDLAEIRYPIGRGVCKRCKAICSSLFLGENLNTCKYDTCVKRLGGYKGDQSFASCSELPLP
ncbi:hypothetical protein EC973_006873, partial [Apophysomyces ossiformis]